MRTETYNVKGMHCASCAVNIEKNLQKADGVRSVVANYGNETVKLAFDEAKTNPSHLSKTLEPLGYSLLLPVAKESGPSAKEMGMSESEHIAHLGLNQSKQDKLAELVGMHANLTVAIPMAAFSLFVMGWDMLARAHAVSMPSDLIQTVFRSLLPLMATYMLFVVGKPYLLGFYRFLRYGSANMDTLIGMGTLSAYIYSLAVTAFATSLRPYLNVDQTYFDVTIIVITFIALGKYLEVQSKLKTGDAIEKLLNLQAKTALVIRQSKEQEVPIDQVVHGDLIIVKPGAKIPVDGIVTEGTSFVDEALVTGEPMPVEKTIGATVVAGTLNTTGSFTFKATKVGSETLLAQIVHMVQEAQGSKAPIQALADKISSVFVPVVLVIAFATLATWLLFGTQSLGFPQALSYGLTAFVGVLVIACPCALGLATPTAIIVGVGKGASEGILIKDAATLERLHEVDTVVVDKTGTITKGKPEVVSVKNISKLSKTELISILATLESKSEHPIAQSILGHAKSKKIASKEVQKFESLKGKGLKGLVDKIEYFAGNTKLIADLGLSFEVKQLEVETAQGRTPVILATAKEVLGVVMVADAIKPEAIEAVRSLHDLGIKLIMLTGDNANAAEVIAKEAGIDEVVAEVLPEDKLKKIQELQKAGRVVAMAGDGVNDAPALAQADVGIAMGTGTDVAIETAGITLLNGDISKLVKAIRLSKLTMRGIKQNLFWAFFYNIVGIPVAAGILYPFFGLLLSPVFAGLAMAFSSVSVVGNSLRLKAKRL